MAWRTSKVIFYRIPKTGSSWCMEAMRNSGLHLTHCRTIGRELLPMGLGPEHAPPPFVKDKYKRGRHSFCFVRHPVEWYPSMWAFRRWKNKPFDDLLGQYWSNDFAEWVEMILDAWPDGFVSQMYQLFVENVDFVGYQEHLADALVWALECGGEQFDENALRATPPVNVIAHSPRWSGLCEMSPELRERIEQVEQWTVERYYV